MRNLLLASALLLVYPTSHLAAQRPQSVRGATESIAPGSTVEVVQEGVEMKAGTKTVGSVAKGARLKGAVRPRPMDRNSS